jgi:hypothetical protein
MQGSVDPMMTEMIDRIETHDGLFLGRVLAGYDDHRDLVGLVKKRHAFSHGAGGFAAAVPGDKNPIESDFWTLRLGDQEEMVARSEKNAFDEPIGIHRTIGTYRHERVGGTSLAGGNPGDIVSQRVESPDFDWPIEQLQLLHERSLDLVAGGPRMVDNFGCNIALDRSGERQRIEKQSDDHMTLELARNLGGSRQPNFVGDASIQPDHHVLDHPQLPVRRQIDNEPEPDETSLDGCQFLAGFLRLPELMTVMVSPPNHFH